MSPKTGSEWAWDIASKLMVPAVIAISTGVIVHEVRISALEQTRFTDIDGRRLYEEIKREMPPQWLKAQVEEIRKSQRSIELKLERLSSDVKNHDHGD